MVLTGTWMSMRAGCCESVAEMPIGDSDQAAYTISRHRPVLTVRRLAMVILPVAEKVVRARAVRTSTDSTCM